jgi:DNA-binding response OmpR family regulator
MLLNMDLDGFTIMRELGSRRPSGARLPLVGLTRRGDLKGKLAPFDAGVDDILTIPYAPEELLAQMIALVRRSYSDAVTFTPTMKLGEVVVDRIGKFSGQPVTEDRSGRPALQRPQVEGEEQRLLNRPRIRRLPHQQ